MIYAAVALAILAFCLYAAHPLAGRHSLWCWGRLSPDPDAKFSCGATHELLRCDRCHGVRYTDHSGYVWDVTVLQTRHHPAK